MAKVRCNNILKDTYIRYITLDSFIPLTESAVSKLIGCSPKKSCMFDPMSTPTYGNQLC